MSSGEQRKYLKYRTEYTVGILVQDCVSHYLTSQQRQQKQLQIINLFLFRTQQCAQAATPTPISVQG